MDKCDQNNSKKRKLSDIWKSYGVHIDILDIDDSTEDELLIYMSDKVFYMASIGLEDDDMYNDVNTYSKITENISKINKFLYTLDKSTPLIYALFEELENRKVPVYVLTGDGLKYILNEFELEEVLNE